MPCNFLPLPLVRWQLLTVMTSLRLIIFYLSFCNYNYFWCLQVDSKSRKSRVAFMNMQTLFLQSWWVSWVTLPSLSVQCRTVWCPREVGLTTESNEPPFCTCSRCSKLIQSSIIPELFSIPFPSPHLEFKTVFILLVGKDIIYLCCTLKFIWVPKNWWF